MSLLGTETIGRMKRDSHRVTQRNKTRLDRCIDYAGRTDSVIDIKNR